MKIGQPFPEVLVAAQAGAEWAWQRLYASVAAGVRGYVAAQGAHDPDDLTGEVLLHLVRGIDRFVGDEAAFRSWVFLVAHHRVIDERRRSRRRVEVLRRLPLSGCGATGGRRGARPAVAPGVVQPARPAQR